MRVAKAGEIIPKIVGVVAENRAADAVAVIFPKVCPACGTLLVRDEKEAANYCPNATACAPQIIGRLEHFVMRDAMYIDGFGEKILAKLYNSRRADGTPVVQNPADLYDLTEETILSLGEGFKEKTAQNLMAGLEASKQRPFQNLLFGLGLRYVGETVADKLAQHFGTLDAMMGASLEELEQVPEIGKRIAQSVKAYLEDESNQALVLRLRDKGLQMAYVERKRVLASNRLSGKSFLISGTFEALSREQLAGEIEKHGGKMASGVSAKLDYLIGGQKAGASKLDKAKKLNVPVLDEAQIMAMLAG